MKHALAFLLLLPAAAQTPEVRRVLDQNCIFCHGQAQKMNGLDLRSRESMLRGGSRGPALVPGDSASSVMFQAVMGGGGVSSMPPGTKLPADAVEAIRRWIDAGAPAGEQAKWRYSADDLWAFQPLRRSAKDDGVDSFVLEKLRTAGLEPSPKADRVTLIRRVTFDLIGLPPAPDEIEAFVNDRSPDAFRKVVERLLASPRYGERWGRHWLDVVRYADTDGYSNDFERPNAWRYRDYVIRSFNQDKPYDRFVREQIAGDELNPGDPESLIATGFLRMGPWEHTAMSVAAVTRQMFLDDVTHHTITAFLGLTMGCARCHDHKFDPISTRDYYRVQAVFASTQFEQHRVPFQPWENTTGFEASMARVQEMIRRTQAKLAELNNGELSPEDLARRNAYQKRREIYQRALMRYQPQVYGAASKGQAMETFVLPRGDLRSPSEKVAPGVLQAVRLESQAVPESVEGRRAALANWIANPSNPLTARVMVNRIWQYHFGRGLVATPNNFGKMGQRPSHPELLDWLAARFIEQGWSIKAMHRLIVLSEAYQRSSRPRDAARAAQVDPDNRLLSYFSPRRLEAEELRDSILAVSGELSADAGGPGTFPEINEDLAGQPRLIMGQISPAYQPSLTRRERNRRTIYTFQQRTMPNPVIDVFNGPDLNESCERRAATIMPTQVFSLFNSKFAHDAALAFAARLEKLSATPAARIDQAYRLAFGRLPTDEERKLLVEYVTRREAYHRQASPPARKPRQSGVRSLVHELTGRRFDLEEDAGPGEYEENLHASQVSPAVRALADAMLIVFNSNEFVYVF